MDNLNLNFFDFQKIYEGQSSIYIDNKYAKYSDDYQNLDIALECGFFDNETIEKIKKLKSL